MFYQLNWEVLVLDSLRIFMDLLIGVFTIPVLMVFVFVCVVLFYFLVKFLRKNLGYIVMVLGRSLLAVCILWYYYSPIEKYAYQYKKPLVSSFEYHSGEREVAILTRPISIYDSLVENCCGIGGGYKKSNSSFANRLRFFSQKHKDRESSKNFEVIC